MDYFTNYNLCLQFYDIYNARLKCREFIKYENNAFKLNGRLHNIRGPAFINFYDNGVKEYEAYYFHGKRYNINGPEVIEYYKNGEIKRRPSYFRI